MPGPVTQVVYRVPLGPYFITPVLAVALLPTTWLAHLRWGDSPWSGVGLTLGAVTVVAFTWRAARARGPIVQLQAIGIATVATAWTVCAVLASPFTRPVFEIWILGTVVGSVIVAVQRVLRNGPDEAGEGRENLLAASVKALKDAKLPRPSVNGAKVRQRVEMQPGQPFSDVAKARAEVASALDLPATAVRPVPDRNSERRGELHIVPVDQLGATILWPGPSAPGGSITEPLLLGVMEDGEPLNLWLPGDPQVQRNATHVGIVGMSGAGKTELVFTLSAEVLTRVDAELWLADPRKGEQLPQWLLDSAARIALDRGETERFMDDLLGDVSARAGVLGRAGYRQWQPECPLPYRVALLDESAGMLTDPAFVDLAETCRSAGISLVFALQRATADRISTSARSNIAAWLAMGVKDEMDASKALSEETLAAGAAPWIWRSDNPGYLYAEIPGVGRERWAMPARSFQALGEQEMAAAVMEVRDRLGLRSAPAPVRTAPPAAETPAPEATEDADEPIGGELEVDPSQPIRIPPDLPRVPIGTPPEQAMPPAQARAVLVQHLQERAAAGHDEVRPAELADVLETVGRSAPWLSGQLKQLCRGPEALLRNTDRGVYRILTPAPAGSP